MREAKEFQKSDERILGDGDFVEQVLSACDEQMERRYGLKAKRYDLEKVVVRVSDLMSMAPSQILQSGKNRKRVVELQTSPSAVGRSLWRRPKQPMATTAEQ